MDHLSSWLAIALWPHSWFFWWWAGYVLLGLLNVAFYLLLYRLVREVVRFVRRVR